MTIRMFAKPPPASMTKEYQEATNEYLKVCFTLFVCHVRDCFVGGHELWPRAGNDGFG